MASIDLGERDLFGWHEALEKGEVHPAELVQASLDRIAAVDGQVHAFLTVTSIEALQEAQQADVTASPLAGIPAAIKDNICTQNVLTTCASRMLHNFRPPYDATVIQRLRSKGAITVGKTNMDEFAMGSSTEHSAFGVTRNPWDLGRVPGGSSGGSAAAVAAGEVPYALGSDTGGSIRQPAAYCGVVGLKPTYGRVSRYGLVAFASSLDQIGPITRTVAESALVMNAISGIDPHDSTSAPVEVPDFTAALTGEIRGLRVGIISEYMGAGIDASVRQAVQQAIQTFERLGAEIVEVHLPTTQHALAVYYLIAPAEASSNLARYDGVRYGYRTPQARSVVEMYKQTRDEGFGTEVKRRILLGTYVLSAGYYDAYYKRALQVRALMKQDFDRAFEHCDLLLSPTTPTPAFTFGEKTSDPVTMYLNDLCTIPANLVGIPALSVPCGWTPEGLPIGLQLMAKAFDEATLFRAGDTYERAAGFSGRFPNLAA